jgi:Transport protein particle (TRAPP) component
MVVGHWLPAMTQLRLLTAHSDTCWPACIQVLTDNPLADFVELPDEYRDLRYSNLLPGVIRGALEMVWRERRGVFAAAVHALLCTLKTGARQHCIN